MLKFKKKGCRFSNPYPVISKTYIPVWHCFGFLEITTCIRIQRFVIKVIRLVSSSLLFFFWVKF